MSKYIKLCTYRVRKFYATSYKKTKIIPTLRLPDKIFLLGWMFGDEIEVYIDAEDKSKILLVNIDYLVRKKLLEK